MYEYNTARANLEKAIGKNIVGNQITLDLDKKKMKAENKKLKDDAKKAQQEDEALRKADKKQIKEFVIENNKPQNTQDKTKTNKIKIFFNKDKKELS